MKPARFPSFSNRAGAHSAQYLTARGERMCCVYENGQVYVDPSGYVYVVSGTSFSAPQVSGAAALLAQAFPNLTGRQIAQILLSSAFDAGAPGTDPIFGRGILDIAKAFQPLGATALAGRTHRGRLVGHDRNRRACDGRCACAPPRSPP